MLVKLNYEEQSALADVLERMQYLDGRSLELERRPLEGMRKELERLTDMCAQWAVNERATVELEFVGVDALLCMMALNVGTAPYNEAEAERLRRRLAEEFRQWGN